MWRWAIALAFAQLVTAQTVHRNFLPFSGGWLGGDAAYSVPLTQTSTLWLFGDTFTGHQRDADTMVRNSVGIRNCTQQVCAIDYFWSGMQTPHPASFFRTSESDFLWPLDGFVANRKLYIFLEQMRTTGSGAFGFDYDKILLATIPNFADPPSRWKITYQTLAVGASAIPGVAAVRDSSFVYAFTLFTPTPNAKFVGLLRIRTKHLTSAAETKRWQYLSSIGEWHAWRTTDPPTDAKSLLAGNITEFSVKFHPALHTWIAIFPTPGFLSNTASFSSASSLLGPWTSARPLFEYPEMQPADPRYTPNVFCYAAKEHPELESPGELTFTYACNSTKIPEIIANTNLYRPNLVTLQLSDIQ